MLTTYSILAFLLCFSSTYATNITYTNVTQANFTELQDTDVAVPGLSHLFVMSRNFVNVVFKPFSDIEEFIFEAVSGSQNGDYVGNVLNQWQTLASFEVGFMVCFVFGCLFIILVPLVGLIMCCCRTCCNNCGGEMEQSVKRAKSSWRYCLCGTLFVFTVFMAIPCIFVYLTNVWASQALQEIPAVTGSALEDLDNYINNVPSQLQHIVNEYVKLDTSLREDIDNINNSLGVPIRDSFLEYTDSALDELMQLSNDTEEARDALQAIQDATDELNAGIDNMNGNLSTAQTNLRNDLNAAGTTCTGNPSCVAVNTSTSRLDGTGADFSSLASLENELTSINQTLNQFNIDNEVEEIIGTINDIPDLVTQNSQEATDQVIDTLDSINSSLNNAVNELPLEFITDLSESINTFGDAVSNALSTYNDDYDGYRYAAGAVLASVIAIIVVLYWVGMLSGTLSFAQYTSERSGCSNCGGILVMSAVGLSFIFSWLLMILVMITFTIGGHGERYLCQNLEAPYEGLRFVDAVIRNEDTGNFSISLLSTIQGCEDNEAIYVAGNLEQVANITGLVQGATSQVNDFRENLDNLTVDLSNINTYPQSVQDALDSMKNSGIESIDFQSYIEQINRGLTSTNLIAYAQFLNDSADNMTSFNSDASTLILADQIRGHSAVIVGIQRNQVDPLSQSLSTLNASVLRLQEISTGFNETIDNLAVSLNDLNSNIRNNGSERVAEVTRNFANSIIDDILGYANYVVGQVTEQFGACRPIFVVYTKMTQILCSYLLEILNGFWFSLGWCVFFLIPSAIVGMKLAKFYRTMPEGYDKEDAHWNDMEMETVGHVNNNNSKKSSSKLRPNDRLVEIERALSGMAGEIGEGSNESVLRSFRAASAKQPDHPSLNYSVQRFSRSAASNDTEVLRRWNQNKPIVAKVVEDQASPSLEEDLSSEESETKKSASSSAASGESVRRAEVDRTRVVKSFVHLLQPSVESRDTRRTVSDARDAAAVLMRWKESSKVHPEQYY